MTAKRAKELGFTHHAEMYGFKGYYCDSHEESDHETFRAKWIVTDWLVEFMIYIEVLFGINEGFPILMKEKL